MGGGVENYDHCPDENMLGSTKKKQSLDSTTKNDIKISPPEI